MPSPHRIHGRITNYWATSVHAIDQHLHELVISRDRELVQVERLSDWHHDVDLLLDYRLQLTR